MTFMTCAMPIAFNSYRQEAVLQSSLFNVPLNTLLQGHFALVSHMTGAKNQSTQLITCVAGTRNQSNCNEGSTQKKPKQLQITTNICKKSYNLVKLKPDSGALYATQPADRSSLFFCSRDPHRTH